MTASLNQRGLPICLCYSRSTDRVGVSEFGYRLRVCSGVLLITGKLKENDHGMKLSSATMQLFPKDETRLQLLNEAQPERPWRSSLEKRRCIMCERTFRGRDVVVRPGRTGQLQLACPTCDSGPQFWVRLGNPLLEEHV